jgi:hypothetical protein
LHLSMVIAMPDWKVIQATVTASGDPRQFYDESGEVFVLALERVSGGNDTHMPRRVIGTGRDRASAVASAHATMRTYDSIGRILPSR